MKNVKIVHSAIVLILIFVLTMIGPSLSGAAQKNTLDNLMAAYNGETHAHAKYLEYAKKADEEGYRKVASLFRAAASAEKIHLTNHARVIKSMGGTPKADVQPPTVKSTRENLVDAVKGESYEQSTMYPGFIAQAKQENNPDAIRTFTYAVAAEGEHAKLYKKALADLAGWKTSKTDFYVCPTCGYTLEKKPAFVLCPVCSTPAALYRKVA